jgi:cytochrome c551/c552
MRYPHKAFVLGVLSAACVGLTGLAGLRLAEAGGMGAGMMGPGMMGFPGTSGQPAPVRVNPDRAKALLSYIHDQSPACLQCHAVSEAGFGPSFASISASYAGQAADAERLLAAHIAHGFGRMPPGLVSDAQAARLATLILELPATSRP